MIKNVPEIREAVEQDLNCIAKINSFNSLERIRGNFELVSEEFKIGEILTQTMKLQRRKAKDFYAAEI
jgi:long-subunit acyl-CoA synthetase (AMP-forming)